MGGSKEVCRIDRKANTKKIEQFTTQTVACFAEIGNSGFMFSETCRKWLIRLSVWKWTKIEGSRVGSILGSKKDEA